MNVEKYTVYGKEVTLYIAEKKDSPLIILNSFQGDGSDVFAKTAELSWAQFSLLNISGLDWNLDMTPWYAEPLSWEKDAAFGGADEYLGLLLDEIIPKAKEIINMPTPKTGIAGYSLGGLFALYSLYRSDMFDMAASISGSLWFPHFAEYIFENEMKSKPEKIYISLGDKEAKTGNKILRTVQDNTEKIASHYKDLGYDAYFELNPGNHFKEPELRTARGITNIISGSSL